MATTEVGSNEVEAFEGGPIAALLTRRPSIGLVILLAGLPAMLAGWSIMLPDIMLAEQNAVDLLFNLAGAWQFHAGRVQHVDFHEAVGPLNFLLTLAGFHLVGLSPFAFLAGALIATAALFAAAVVASVRRLPLVAAVIFVLFVCLPAAMPTNVGNMPDNFTFAMSYNRYGWGAIGILCLILFVPPRWSRGLDRIRIDPVCGLLLLLAMFYVKITYFLVGVGALGLALLLSEHIRAQRGAWIVVGLLVMGNALAPHSHAYLADLWWAVESGLPNSGPRRLILHGVLANSGEIAVYAIGLIAACWLWRRGFASVQLPVAAAFLIGASVMLFAQNTQMRGLPLGTVVLFALYGAALSHRILSRPALLVALLMLPALTVLSAAGTFAAYAREVVSSQEMLVATDTNIHGLAVPKRWEQGAPSRSQTLYMASLLDAASLFSDGARKPGRIQVVDRINPLPFMLGFDPPRGGDLFWESSAPPRPVAEMLGDADYVLVPKFSTAPGLTGAAHRRFGDYLAEFFPLREETEQWILYSRSTPRTEPAE